MCGFTKLFQLGANQLIAFGVVGPHSLAHRERQETRKQVHKVRSWGGELDGFRKCCLPRWFQSAKVWDKVIVDEVVVLIDSFIVTFQSAREVLQEGGSGRGWEVREISTLLNDQGITPYKGRHNVSFQSCLLATDLVSIIAHTYTLIHTHITHLHIIIFLQFSSISFPLISFFTQCWSLSIVEMCM